MNMQYLYTVDVWNKTENHTDNLKNITEDWYDVFIHYEQSSCDYNQELHLGSAVHIATK